MPLYILYIQAVKPLIHNLDANTYGVFELDPVKYTLYESVFSFVPAGYHFSLGNQASIK